MKKALTILATAFLATSSFAWIEQLPPGAKFVPETSQEELAKLQQYQTVIGEVGTVHDRTDKVESEEGRSDSDAAAALRSGAERKRAEDAMKSAEKKSKPKQKGWLWGLVLGVGGFGGVMAAKQWANKTITPLPGTKKPKW